MLRVESANVVANDMEEMRKDADAPRTYNNAYACAARCAMVCMLHCVLE